MTKVGKLIFYTAEVYGWTNEELRDKLKENGLQNGPLTDSTVEVYRRILIRKLVGSLQTGEDIPKDQSPLMNMSFMDYSGVGRSSSPFTPIVQKGDENVTPVSLPDFQPVYWNEQNQSYELLKGRNLYGSQNVPLFKRIKEDKQVGTRWIVIMCTIAIVCSAYIAYYFLHDEEDPLISC